MTIYQNNYQKILQVIPGIFELEEFVKLSAPGAKDLNVLIRKNSERLGDKAIFVDAVLPGIRHRLRILSVAKAVSTPVTAIWINTRLETALSRNGMRPLDEQIPEDVINHVFSNFEPPAFDEGFSEIYMINEADFD